MPTREERARLATNTLLTALNDACTGIGIESLRFLADGFRVLFRKGPVTHLESGIDESTLEDGPGTSKNQESRPECEEDDLWQPAMIRILLALLCRLALGTSTAECAWVLWVEEPVGSNR
jgi:hypothetical protein